MPGILIVAETEGDAAARNEQLVGLAQSLAKESKQDVSIAILGPDADRLVSLISQFDVRHVVAAALEPDKSSPSARAELLIDLIRAEEPSVVLCCDSLRVRSFVAAVASELRLGFASGVTAAWYDDSGLVVQRGAFGDLCTLDMDFTDKGIALVTVDPQLRTDPPRRSATAAPVRTVV
ncbi:adenine nucleotide alpha hydrolase family protein [Streptomyces thinghirensis]|uniref:Electron transfer flavoprotein alpha/beta-subunit N-terminal domain-containing protein n=1 Tax=Streptomyces thinghirensis TaxID=551547 RepID=A0ABP9T4Z3_9ACTN